MYLAPVKGTAKKQFSEEETNYKCLFLLSTLVLEFFCQSKFSCKKSKIRKSKNPKLDSPYHAVHYVFIYKSLDPKPNVV
jgi:hypothetical protein